jgi:glutamate decarboxylase
LSNIHIPLNAKSTVGRILPEETSDDPEKYEPGLPVVSFRLSDEFKKENPNIQQRWIQVIR